MLRELAALGVPKRNCSLVIKRILGDLGDFKIIEPPSFEEIQRTGEDIDDEDDDL